MGLSALRKGPPLTKQPERRLAVIGNPFLRFHCTAIPDKLITIKCWLKQGTPCTAGKKNEASQSSDSRIAQLTPLNWTRGHCGLPVTTTTYKQTVHSAFQSMAEGFLRAAGTWSISAIEKREGLCPAEEEALGSDISDWWGQLGLREPWRVMLCLTIWELVEVYCRLQMRVYACACCLSMVCHSSTRQWDIYPFPFTYGKSLTGQLSTQEIENTFKNALYIYAQAL